MTKESIAVSIAGFLLTIIVTPIVSAWLQFPAIIAFIFSFVFAFLASLAVAWGYNEYKRRQY